jgi:2-desacetyl-2-hydroxyethyl bacteriochlorophyllide A dehydrogenase
MKAIKIEGGKPATVETAVPSGDMVRVKVASASICGSDLHMMAKGWLDGTIPGHEVSGYTDDGTAVALEPVWGCGDCGFCGEGFYAQCDHGFKLLGLNGPGGMAEYVAVPEENLVVLPTGLDINSAALVEPVAVALHGLAQARVGEKDKVLILGAGAIGLATAACLNARGMTYDITARHPHQEVAAHSLGGNVGATDGYDVVIDAVGTSESLAEAVNRLKPRARLGMVGSFWDPVELPGGLCMKEIELIPAMAYKCRRPERTFEQAVALLAENPGIGDTLITHRYPLDGAVEAFATAADRASGAIKVCFEPAL